MHVELVTTGVTPRYRYRIGDRVVPVDGCAPDAFVAQHALRRPMELTSRCPATGVPIRVEFHGDGTVTANPSTAVVGIIDPRTTPEAVMISDADQVDEEICGQQPLFASPAAATAWLRRHPTGGVLTVSRFQDAIKQFLDFGERT